MPYNPDYISSFPLNLLNSRGVRCCLLQKCKVKVGIIDSYGWAFPQTPRIVGAYCTGLPFSKEKSDEIRSFPLSLLFRNKRICLGWVLNAFTVVEAGSKKLTLETIRCIRAPTPSLTIGETYSNLHPHCHSKKKPSWPCSSEGEIPSLFALDRLYMSTTEEKLLD